MKLQTFTRSSRHFLGLITLALAGIAFPDPVAGAVRVWTGKADQFWSNPLNWEGGQVPTSGDMLEFAVEATHRVTIHDLAANLSLAGIVIKGRNYVLAGNSLILEGNLISTSNNSTNRIDLSANLHGEVSFINAGYFNQLELSGQFKVENQGRLILRTSSSILVSGLITATNLARVVQRDPGWVTFGPVGRVRGNLSVEQGSLILTGGSVLEDRSQINGELIIGDNVNPSGYSRVFWQDSNLLSTNTHVTVHRSGIMNLADMAPVMGITEWIRTLAGSGIVDLGPNHLIVEPRGLGSEFSGEIRGSGTLQLGWIPNPPTDTFSGSLTLSGHSPLAGAVNVDLGHLNLRGSLSNAAINLKAVCRLNGTGTVRSLVSTGGIIRPGPGTLRVLDHCALDWWTQLWLPVDGPNAARLKTSSLELNSAFLGASYHGDPADTFTLIEAGSASTDPLRVDGRDLPEGAWIVAGPAEDLQEFQITYAGNGGHDVVLQKVGPYIPPVLRIQRVSATERRLEWPLAAHTYWLEYTPSFSPRFWSTNGLPAPAANDTDFFIIENLPGQERYYRLRR
jgi:hypothetical protein